SLFVFFFSSRRRHTRFSRDWSSDVCSSDLVSFHCRSKRSTYLPSARLWSPIMQAPRASTAAHTLCRIAASLAVFSTLLACGYKRSEERRVGKEGRGRRSPVE